jgi:hypothetical protein
VVEWKREQNACHELLPHNHSCSSSNRQTQADAVILKSMKKFGYDILHIIYSFAHSIDVLFVRISVGCHFPPCQQLDINSRHDWLQVIKCKAINCMDSMGRTWKCPWSMSMRAGWRRIIARAQACSWLACWQ